MKKSVLLIALAGLSINAFAAKKQVEQSKEINEISCKTTDPKAAGAEVHIKLTSVTFAQNSATVGFYNMTMLKDGGTSYDLVPDISGGSFEGKNLKNEVYNGRKYAGHFKFNLTSKAKSAGNFSPDTANIIISPDYTAEKTIPQKNNWDKTWTWDVEVRKHSAVLATHFDDHHGDYIALDCYSVAHVNDSKARP